jgi:hypothetical protein
MSRQDHSKRWTCALVSGSGTGRLFEKKQVGARLSSQQQSLDSQLVLPGGWKTPECMCRGGAMLKVNTHSNLHHKLGRMTSMHGILHWEMKRTHHNRPCPCCENIACPYKTCFIPVTVTLGYVRIRSKTEPSSRRTLELHDMIASGR